MQEVIGKISPWRPTIGIKAMQTNQRVEALKRAKKRFSSPMVVLGLIDTGASMSALDPTVITMLGLAPRGNVSVHTPSTGTAYEKRMTYDALFIAGEETGEPVSKTLQIIEWELASQGILALIGRDFLAECQFIYDGPSKSFALRYETPWRPTTVIAAPTP
jgi:hypothetical protein